MEASWLGPAFPKFHIYLNQIRAEHSPVRHPLQPREQQGFLENMNAFVQIKHWDHEVVFIPVTIVPADQSYMEGEVPGICNKTHFKSPEW